MSITLSFRKHSICVLFLVLTNLPLVASTLPAFNLKSTLSTNYLKKTFPQSPIMQILSCDITQLHKSTRPKLWPKRIPFVVGIDKSQQAFYYQFEPFGFSQLLPFPEKTSPAHAISANNKGHIFLITDRQLYHYRYTPKTKLCTQTNKHPLKKALSVDNSHNRVAVLHPNQVSIFKFSNYALYPLQKTSKKISRHLKNTSPLKITLTKKNNIIILTKESIYVFKKTGQLHTTFPNNHQLTHLDSTEFGDIISSSKHHKTLYKYTQTGLLLDTFELTHLKHPPYALSIYKPYGNLAVFNATEGAYYTMNTRLKTPTLTKNLSKKSLSISCNFITTMPALVSIHINNKQRDNKTQLLNKKLPATQHQLTFPDIPKTFATGTLTIRSQGLYSEANITKKSIPITP